MALSTSHRPLYFDCDAGIDDSMALGFLLSSPEISLVGVGTVSGNTSAEQAAENVLRMLTLDGRDDVPVALGQHDFRTHSFEGGPHEIHGANGIGNVELPETHRSLIDQSAPEFIVELSKQYPGELEILTVGPMTNLAAAIDLDPSLPERVKQVTAMGGAAWQSGNVSPVAEANVWNDPEAAQLVLEQSWPLTLVPLDVTLRNVLEESHRKQLLESDRPLARAIGEMLDLYFDFYLSQYGRRCSALHDPLAAAIAVGSEVPTYTPAVPVCVDTTDGPGRGQTIADLRGQLAGPKDEEGATTRVALETTGVFPNQLVHRLLDQ